MNQILVTEKLYITPELRKKKKVYKINFLLSILLVLILVSIYAYSEYDRNKSEEVSQQILEDMGTDTTVATNNVLVVVLDDTEQEGYEDPQIEAIAEANKKVQATNSGFRYVTIATVSIPKLGLQYPVLDGETDSAEETEALLKISPTKFWGPEPNEVGNFCIVGHNYRNTKFFSKVPTLESGDIINLTDLSGRTLEYKIYNKYQVDPNDVSCTTQLTNGKKEVTLITCTDDSKHRVVVKARQT